MYIIRTIQTTSENISVRDWLTTAHCDCLLVCVVENNNMWYIMACISFTLRVVWTSHLTSCVKLRLRLVDQSQKILLGHAVFASS